MYIDIILPSNVHALIIVNYTYFYNVYMYDTDIVLENFHAN